ncbi:PQQ-binding-like beta-propeller repeat protein [Streptomyces sp. NPDC058818]|uniref:outer membrane protein assembly factor BamB family protein n=1 Tax=Streptomyces sp. NPDC058818 TaxID=3346640 RepID=UPI0036B90C2E
MRGLGLAPLVIARFPRGLVGADASTGTLRWTHPTGSSATSPPAVVDSTLYIDNWDKKVYALNAATGQVGAS